MPVRDDDLAFCPTLTAHGQRMLDFLREHPAAPRFSNQSGNRLLAAEVDALRGFVRDVQAADVGWPRGGRGWGRVSLLVLGIGFGAPDVAVYIPSELRIADAKAALVTIKN